MKEKPIYKGKLVCQCCRSVLMVVKSFEPKTLYIESCKNCENRNPQ